MHGYHHTSRTHNRSTAKPLQSTTSLTIMTEALTATSTVTLSDGVKMPSEYICACILR